MQINGTYNLPVINRQQAEPVNARQRQPVAPALSQTLPERPDQDARQRTSRQTPVFLQPANHNLSRTGEQAMRAYQNAATAGHREELVNRIHELA